MESGVINPCVPSIFFLKLRVQKIIKKIKPKVAIRKSTGPIMSVQKFFLLSGKKKDSKTPIKVHR